MKQENRMGVAPVPGLILSMSVPIMISMIVQSMYNIVSISAVEQSDPVVHIYTCFSSYYLPLCSITSDWI